MVTDAAHAFACTTCAFTEASSTVRPQICTALVREAPTLQPTDPREAHDLLDAARAIVAERTIAAFAALNRIRTNVDRTSPFDAAARALSTALLRDRRRP
jgi:hypothetical protein